MKAIRFKNETIRRCKECGGLGYTVKSDGERAMCPSCEGTGFVKRIAEGEVRYEPYIEH